MLFNKQYFLTFNYRIKRNVKYTGNLTNKKYQKYQLHHVQKCSIIKSSKWSAKLCFVVLQIHRGIYCAIQ